MENRLPQNPKFIPEASQLPHPPYATASQDNQEQQNKTEREFVRLGSGQFIKPPKATRAHSKRDATGNIKLNFNGADVREAAKVILGDMLQLNYSIDPRIKGDVSMLTSQPISEEDLIPSLELMLRSVDAAIIQEQDGYRILPLSDALSNTRIPQLGDSKLPIPQGFHIRIIPIKHTKASDMADVIEPFIKGGIEILRVDSKRNMLLIAGSNQQINEISEIVDMFDVNAMQGLSMAMFNPKFVSATKLSKELNNLLNHPDNNMLGGLMRFMVINRLNSLIAITPNRQYLAAVREWVERLDQVGDTSERRLYVYRVQNGKAKTLAALLSSLFNGEGNAISTISVNKPTRNVVPNQQEVTIGDAANISDNVQELSTPPSTQRFKTSENGENVSIIADEDNNSLLVLARAADYQQILSALEQLDINPMQVLIEVTVAEVSLTDNLQHGVEWYFSNKVDGHTAEATLDLGTASGLNALQPGFSYALKSAGGDIRAVLNLLSTESNLSVISSPTLLVLNNQEASIKVGDEVPVATQQQQATTANSNIVNSIEYRETGIKLSVKPRINAGGLVIMEVTQEVSLVPTANNADPLTPRIQTRELKSTIAVNSGDAIILGGLIQDNRTLSESGIPLLHKLPVVGNIFGTKSDDKDRTELLVLITPKAVSNRATALQVTENFRRRLHSLLPFNQTEKQPLTSQ